MPILNSSKRLLFGVTILALLGTTATLVSPSADAATRHSLFPNAAMTDAKTDPDNGSVELGLRIRPNVNGKTSTVKFFKSRQDTAITHTVNIWNANGELLGTGQSKNESKKGWQSVVLAKPVTMTANSTYVISYHTAKYVATNNYFKADITKGPITIFGSRNGVFKYGPTSAFPNETHENTNYWVDFVFTSTNAKTTTSSTAKPTDTTAKPAATESSTTSTNPPSRSTTSQPQPTTSTTPPASGACVGAKHMPGGPDGKGGCWPGPNNTGVPAGTLLSTYAGSCTITAANTIIDAKTINCDLQIKAANVKITRSKISGSINTDPDSTGYSFSVSDSEINIGNRDGTGIGEVNYTADRVHIYGGNRSAICFNNCTISNSYTHGQYTPTNGVSHESGIRMNMSTTLRHNAIACDAPDVPPDGGCSASLTGYGEWNPIQKNAIEGNLIMATTGGYCAYGGSTAKVHGPAANNIVFKDNVFQRGTRNGQHGKPVCGYYGAITDFDAARPGNAWINNTFDDGSTLNP